MSVIVLCEHGLPELQRVLASIAHQSLWPAEVIIAAPSAERDARAAVAAAALPPGLPVHLVGTMAGSDPWADMCRLVDACSGAAIAVVTDGVTLAPAFLLSAQQRFTAPDGGEVAAVAIRRDVPADPLRAVAGEFERDELSVEELLREPEPRAAWFIYRREALERVGGWPDLPRRAAQWDLHLRLIVEWRIGLLPGHLAASETPARGGDSAAGIAFRSAQVRNLLRQSPAQLGLLLTVSRGLAAAEEREAELRSRIDHLSRQIEALALAVGRVDSRAGRVSAARRLA